MLATRTPHGGKEVLFQKDVHGLLSATRRLQFRDKALERRRDRLDFDGQAMYQILDAVQSPESMKALGKKFSLLERRLEDLQAKDRSIDKKAMKALGELVEIDEKAANAKVKLPSLAQLRQR